MCTHCERVANTQTPASGKKKKKNPRGEVWCTESGLSAAREEIPHLDKSVSWAVSRWEAEESAALLDCWPAVRFWSDAEPQSAWWRAREALAASGGVCLHLHPPITPLYASSVNTHTHAHRIRSDHHVQNWGDSLPGVFAHRKTLHFLLWWSWARTGWAQRATGRCSRLICANQSRLCWATSPCDPDWLTQGCN